MAFCVLIESFGNKHLGQILPLGAKEMRKRYKEILRSLGHH